MEISAHFFLVYSLFLAAAVVLFDMFHLHNVLLSPLPHRHGAPNFGSTTYFFTAVSPSPPPL